MKWVYCRWKHIVVQNFKTAAHQEVRDKNDYKNSNFPNMKEVELNKNV